MEHGYTIAGAPKVALPVRVRGMSTAHRFFDEETETTRVTEDFIVVRISNVVDLEIEMHVANIETQVGGTYRVVWINNRAENGTYAVGLEPADREGEIWDRGLIPPQDRTVVPAPVDLECSRCHGRVTTTIPEADPEALGEGFSMARSCDTCRATTAWVFKIEKAAARGPAAPVRDEPAEEQRVKGRAPLKLMIQVTRRVYGLPQSDICETVNVSRTGAFFMTEKAYDVGDTVDVVLPYHPNAMAIPVPARVVRREDVPGSSRKGVAIKLNP